MRSRQGLAPLLEQLLTQSRRLLDTTAGSISLLDAGRDSYGKVAEHGASCRVGHSFPLDEGVTGRVVARRRPVVLGRYSDVRSGHLSPAHPASHGAVAAVPIWWRGDVVGANVVFAGGHRRFAAGEVDELEVLTQTAAPAIVRAGAVEPSLAHLIREHPRSHPEVSGVSTRVTEVGRARPVSAVVAGVVVDIVTMTERVAARRDPGARVHVAVAYQPDGLRLLVQDESGPGPGDVLTDPLGTGAHSWQELVAAAGGGISVEQVAGWGMLLRADLPYAPAAPESPFTPREREVLALVARGLSDRAVASALRISPKTVEKHVAAVLRKTGTGGRTAAVVHCLERGWLPPTRARQD